MRGVVVEGDQRSRPSPKTQDLEPWIDQAFRLGASLFILGGAGTPVLEFTIRADHPAIRGDALDTRLAEAEVRERQGTGQRRAGCASRLLHHLLKKLQVERPRCPRYGLEDPLRLQVGKRGVMRVDAVQSHIFGYRVSRFGQRLPPDAISLVANATPVQGT
jgi:hypothetical protein